LIFVASVRCFSTPKDDYLNSERSLQKVARCLGIIGILEGLKADGDTTIRRHLGPKSLAAFDSLEY
jgi:hypothetical protein